MERKISVENLGPDIDAYVLSREFVKFGSILSASIDYDDQFISLGKGQIVFQKPSSATAAIKSRVFAFGRPLVVKLVGSKVSLRKINKTYSKIFVKNFDLLWDDCDLTQQFEKFGDIVDVSIAMTDNVSNGYGSVTFKRHDSAEQAVKEMNDKVIGDKVLTVEPYIPKTVREDINSKSLDFAKDMLERATQHNNLHVKNLPQSVDEAELRKLFEVFGPVTSVKVARDGSQSKGYGFVCFSSEKNAETARYRMNGYSLNSKILEVNFNQGKEQRQHYLQLLNSAPSQKKIPFNDSRKKATRGKSVDCVKRCPAPLFSFSSKQF